jgi:F5/8 type C domain
LGDTPKLWRIDFGGKLVLLYRVSLIRNLAAAVGLLAVIAVALLAAPSANAQRGVPVGLFNVNNQVMNSSRYVYALRFVLDQDTPLYRFISGFNLEGSDYLGGRTGYADGSSGRIRARLVEVDSNGEPDLSHVLAEETVGAAQRYQESKIAYGTPGLTQLLYFNTWGVQLKAGRMYAMTYQNVDPYPTSNWFSENSPTVKESVAGPNGVNNLDPDAPDAIANLDPREAVAWSQDSGQTWAWGRHVGEGNTPGSYGGSATGDDGTRLPWYGWQTSPISLPQSNQPYYAYRQSGSYTLRVRSVPSRTTFTAAGGYAPVGASAGVITVRNLTTGEVGRTAWLGSGLVEGPLDDPVSVEAGQGYEISNTGTVLKAEGDSFIRSTFGLGSVAWIYETLGYGYDRAQLYAVADIPDPGSLPEDQTPERLSGGKPATASSSETSDLTPGLAVDQSSSTRWSSNFLDNQWFRVDLGAVRWVNRVSINWEAAYASRYRIETSLDGTSYWVAANVSLLDQKRQDTTFPVRLARYVRVVGVERATEWGISFFDFDVYGFSGV